MKQEPVAYRVWDRMGGISYRRTKPSETEYVEWDELYTDSTDAMKVYKEAYEAGRTDMKEEAAKMCDSFAKQFFDCEDVRSRQITSLLNECAAAIRGLK